MEHLRYVDFELNIEQKGDRYVARILRSPSGEASHSFELPFSEQDREIFVLHGSPSFASVASTEVEAERVPRPPSQLWRRLLKRRCGNAARSERAAARRPARP